MCQRWAPPPQQGGGGKPPILGVFLAAALIVVLVTQTGAINHHPGVQALNQKGGGPALAGIFGGFLQNAAKQLPGIKIGSPFSKSSPKAAKAARYALAQRGDRYVYGASGPHAWDCSGLTSRAWAKAGVKIPRTAKGQLRGLKRVRGKPQRGDLIVYRSSASPSGWHVAIAVGQGQMVEARGRRYGVTQGRIRGGWAGVVRP